MTQVTEPKLAAPGAGLPGPEALIAKVLLAFRTLIGNRESFNAKFTQERQRIQILLGQCNADQAGERVLIKRVRGLEDSSRYWSVWMTLDHLRIVHHAMAEVIKHLGNGTVPDGKADTAKVKPDPGVTSAVVADYEKSCDILLQTVAAVKDLDTKVRFVHPWFGPLNANQWHALAAGHHAIHRKQIEQIIKGLSGRKR